jgi:hypothetical protein
MRYSLRAFLLAVAYVALVTGTLISGSATLSALVWSVTAIAFCYAFITLCFAAGKPKAMAVGFVLMSAAYLAVVYFAPARTPAGELFADMGYRATEGGWYSQPRGRFIAGSQAVFNALNAAGTMLAGLVGCLIGSIAYRNTVTRDQ